MSLTPAQRSHPATSVAGTASSTMGPIPWCIVRRCLRSFVHWYNVAVLHAGVAELVDAPDSKSGGAKAPCRFEPDLRYSRSSCKTQQDARKNKRPSSLLGPLVHQLLHQRAKTAPLPSLPRPDLACWGVRASRCPELWLWWRGPASRRRSWGSRCWTGVVSHTYGVDRETLSPATALA